MASKNGNFFQKHGMTETQDILLPHSHGTKKRDSTRILLQRSIRRRHVKLSPHVTYILSPFDEYGQKNDNQKKFVCVMHFLFLCRKIRVYLYFFLNLFFCICIFTFCIRIFILYFVFVSVCVFCIRLVAFITTQFFLFFCVWDYFTHTQTCVLLFSNFDTHTHTHWLTCVLLRVPCCRY